jgi:Tol biopolymer transport system component
LKSDQLKVPTSWSPDGRFLLFQSIDPKTGEDIWLLSLEDGHSTVSLIRTAFNE